MVVAPSPEERITMKVFPNPTEGFLNLEINLPSQTVVYASIYDISGKEVLNLGKIQSDDLGIKITKRLNVQGLANGVYQLVVFDSQNKTTKQFIKICVQCFCKLFTKTMSVISDIRKTEPILFYLWKTVVRINY